VVLAEHNAASQRNAAPSEASSFRPTFLDETHGQLSPLVKALPAEEQRKLQRRVPTDPASRERAYYRHPFRFIHVLDGDAHAALVILRDNHLRAMVKEAYDRQHGPDTDADPKPLIEVLTPSLSRAVGETIRAHALVSPALKQLHRLSDSQVMRLFDGLDTADTLQVLTIPDIGARLRSIPNDRFDQIARQHLTASRAKRLRGDSAGQRTRHTIELLRAWHRTHQIVAVPARRKATPDLSGVRLLSEYNRALSQLADGAALWRARRQKKDFASSEEQVRPDLIALGYDRAQCDAILRTGSAAGAAVSYVASANGLTPPSARTILSRGRRALEREKLAKAS
jgi:hypothetical protein